jgi:hypothetical protein
MTLKSLSQKTRYIALSVTFAGCSLLLAACSGSSTSQATAATNQTTASSENLATAKPDFDHNAFDSLLHTYVNTEGKVDYDGLRKDRALLDTYLDALAKANPTSFTNENERNAFYINAYNAHTLRDVLEDVYQKTDSVRKVKGFFDTKKHRVGGEDLTLDAIEKKSRDLKDPRIHFAVVCASTGCPKLQRFAFTGAKLREQLDQVTQEFLADELRGVKIDREKNQLAISSIFKWYAGDFSGATGSVGQVLARAQSQFSGDVGLNFVRDKVSPEIQQFINEKKPTVAYLDYDWTLNSQKPPQK